MTTLTKVITLTNGVTASPSTTEVMETAQRRARTGKISELHELLQRCPESDELTHLLQEVCEFFQKELKTPALTPLWEKRLYERLHEVLTDDLIHLQYDQEIPLDEPLWGSDGFFYSTPSLALFFAEAPLDRQYCSPITGAPDFYVRPHPAASLVIEWLKRHQGSYNVNDDLRSAYEEYQESSGYVPLPTLHNRRTRDQILAQVKDIQQLTQDIQGFIDEVNDLPDFQSVTIEKYQALLLDNEAKEANLLANIDALQRISEQQAAQFESEMMALERSVEEQEAHNQFVEKECQDLAEKFQVGEEDVAQLQKVMDALGDAIRKAKRARQRRWLASGLVAAVQIVFFHVPVLQTIVNKFVEVTVDKALVRWGVPLEAITIARATINGISSAPQRIKSVEWAVRGAGLGVLRVQTNKLVQKTPYAALAADAIQGAADASFLSSKPNPLFITKNVMARTTSGVASRILQIPIQVSANPRGGLDPAVTLPPFKIGE